jgi:hypothetical protein
MFAEAIGTPEPRECDTPVQSMEVIAAHLIEFARDTVTQ